MVKMDPLVCGASWLYHKSMPQLRAIAVELNISKTSSMGKDELVQHILDVMNPLPVEPAPLPLPDTLVKTGEDEKNKVGEPNDITKPNCSGYLKIKSGFGFLKGEKNITVPTKQIVEFGLKENDFIQGIATVASEKGELVLNAVVTVNHKDLLANYEKKPTPVSPFERLELESHDPSVRTFDLFAPVGKGQRGFLLAPPKVGATTLLKNLAEAIAHGNPGIMLFALLIDEKPEIISDFETVQGCSVFSSTFDQTPKESTDIIFECFEKALALLKQGDDVVVLIDGIAKLVKAFDSSGAEIISPDNVSITSIQKVQNFLSKATKYEDSGSLTVISSLVADENSHRDQLIFSELKGKENLMCTLIPPVGEIFPFFDFENTQTTKEELFIEKKQLSKIRKLRREILKIVKGEKREKVLLRLFERFPSNQSLVEEFQSSKKESSPEE